MPFAACARRPIRLAVALTLAFAATTAYPGTAAVAAYSDPLTSYSTTGLGLVWHSTPATAIQALDNALPNVSVATVLSSANHPMRTCDSTETAALPIAPVATAAMCWDTVDAAGTVWNPQGITTSGDADNDGAWGANTVLLSGWQYTVDDGRRNDARVAFIDYTNPASAAYRWVYLVAPDSTGSTFAAAKAHAGGMIWYGDKLLVSAAGNSNVAIRVFSMSHILQATDGAATIGKTSSGYAAYGYQYVMPQVGYYTYADGDCDLSTNTAIPCFSSLSLDRSTSPDSLVTAEYFANGLGGRVARYSFGADYLLAANASNGVAATQAYQTGVANMQGVLSWGGRWYFAHSSATSNGQLWRGAPGQAGVSKTCTNPGSSDYMCWAMHPEALTYFLATGLVWSVTEWPNQRVVFAVPLTSFP